MGYDVRATKCRFEIPRSSEREAYDALVRFNAATPDEVKRGGTFGNGVAVKWFSFMEPDFSSYEDLRHLMSDLGFSYVDDDENETLVFSGWYGDKMGQEDLIVEAISHLIVPGGCVEWIGEDCRRWKWEFSDGSMFVVEADTEAWSSVKTTPTQMDASSREKIKALSAFRARMAPANEETES